MTSVFFGPASVKLGMKDVNGESGLSYTRLYPLTHFDLLLGQARFSLAGSCGCTPTLVAFN